MSHCVSRKQGIGQFPHSHIQAALVIRGGYVPREYREYQNREYQVQQ
jgi:hypothetical protein